MSIFWAFPRLWRGRAFRSYSSPPLADVGYPLQSLTQQITILISDNSIKMTSLFLNSVTSGFYVFL